MPASWLRGTLLGSVVVALGAGGYALGCVGDDPSITPSGDSDAATTDAAGSQADTSPATDGALPVDAGRDGPCDLEGQFGPPTRIASLAGPTEDFAAVLTPDELTIYFARGNAPSTIYEATRTIPSGPFSTPVTMPANINIGDTLDLAMGPDVNRLYFASNRSGSYKIYVAMRSPANPWSNSTVSPVELLDAGVYRHFSPTIAADDTLYFVAGPNAGGDLDIYRAIFRANAYDPAMPVAELNSPTVVDGNPVVSTDGTLLYFASPRAGTKGDRDIWLARRSSTSVGFSPAQNVSELNTASADVPSWLSPDKCRLYFHSARPGGAGSLDIYVADRPR
jgi:hypothetical protein